MNYLKKTILNYCVVHLISFCKLQIQAISLNCELLLKEKYEFIQGRNEGGGGGPPPAAGADDLLLTLFVPL